MRIRDQRELMDKLAAEVAQLRKEVDELKAGKTAKAAPAKKPAAKKPAGTAKK